MLPPKSLILAPRITIQILLLFAQFYKVNKTIFLCLWKMLYWDPENIHEEMFWRSSHVAGGILNSWEGRSIRFLNRSNPRASTHLIITETISPNWIALRLLFSCSYIRLLFPEKRGLDSSIHSKGCQLPRCSSFETLLVNLRTSPPEFQKYIKGKCRILPKAKQKKKKKNVC